MEKLSVAGNGIQDHDHKREQEGQNRQDHDDHHPLGKATAKIGGREVLPTVRALRRVFIDRFTTIGAIDGVFVLALVVHDEMKMV